MLHKSLFVVLSVGAVACSSVLQSANPFPEKQARCDLRTGKPQCTDLRKFQGPSLATFQGVCGTLTNASKGAAGYTEDKTCDTAEMWGGCEAVSGDGSVQTNWYYKSDKYKTVEDAKAECDSGQTWTEPK